MDHHPDGHLHCCRNPSHAHCMGLVFVLKMLTVSFGNYPTLEYFFGYILTENYWNFTGNVPKFTMYMYM